VRRFGVQIPKPIEHDKELFRSLIPSRPSVEIKPMFGNLGAFVNDNMFAGLFGSSIGVRLLDDSSRHELAAVDGTGPFGPAERPMSGYTSLPQAWTTTPELAVPWIEKALTQVASLPAKSRKPKTSSAKAAKTTPR